MWQLIIMMKCLCAAKLLKSTPCISGKECGELANWVVAGSADRGAQRYHCEIPSGLQVKQHLQSDASPHLLSLKNFNCICYGSTLALCIYFRGLY